MKRRGAALLLLAIVAYLAAATVHALVVNRDVGRFDQDVYLLGARALRESGFRADTNRVHMPVYLYVQALFFDPAGPPDVEFLRGKLVNVGVSLVVIAALHAFFSRALPRFEARLLTALAAFTVLVFRAGYVQAEVLFYGVSFFGYAALVRLWERPTWSAALVAGALEAAGHLTKGSVMPGFLVFLVLAGARALRAGRPREAAVHAAAGGTFFVALAPYLVNSKRLFGGYFFGSQSTYVMWCDSWEEFLARERELGLRWQEWHTLPPEGLARLPSMGRYLREHSFAQIAWREIAGLGEMFGNAIASYGWAEFVALLALFAARAPDPEARRRIPAFFLPYVAFYLLLFGFYGPVAAGSRFILFLFLPVAYTLIRAYAFAPGAAARAFGRAITWRDARALAVFLLVVHVLFRIPATIARIPAGG